jgi:hypothetical protein
MSIRSFVIFLVNYFIWAWCLLLSRTNEVALYSRVEITITYMLLIIWVLIATYNTERGARKREFMGLRFSGDRRILQARRATVRRRHVPTRIHFGQT